LLHRTLTVEGHRIIASAPIDRPGLITSDHIDLVIRDVRFDGIGRVDLVIGVSGSSPDTIRVVMTAASSPDPVIHATNEAMARRCLEKSWTTAELRTLVRDALATRLTTSAREIGRPPDVDLSPRLQQTLDALMTGASEKQLADQFGISRHTVHQYVKVLFRRFGVTSRAELMAKLLRR
jgi:DNA-binding NarL/FixJ family response regulator